MSKIAAIQMCSSHVIDENLNTAAQLIEKAAINGAKLVVLPEMFAIIGKNPAECVLHKETYGAGKVQNFLSATAIENDIWIVAGTIPITGNTEHKARAACIVYDNNGNQVGRYDKIHLFDAVISHTESYKESDTIEAGREPIVIDTPVGKLGLGVCYDIRFPELFTNLVHQGAEIIAIPAAFTAKTGKAHWQLLTRCRAIDSFCYVIGACQEGTHSNNRQTYGHSIIVDPWGDVIQENSTPGNGIVYADIDLKKLYDIRQRMKA